MKRVPKDSDSVVCGKFGGEDWLTPDGRQREKCEQGLEHRQVGAASIAYNRSNSVLLIPPTVSWELANAEVVWEYLRMGDSNKMKKRYKLNVEEGYADDLHEHLLHTDYYPEQKSNLDIDRFFGDLEEYSKHHLSKDILTMENLRSRERSGMHFNNDFGKGKKFNSTPIKMNAEWKSDKWPVRSLSRVDRLTELVFITGISRILDDNPEIPIDEGTLAVPERETFGIGRYNYGEGIYIDVSAEWLNEVSKSREADMGSDSRMKYSFQPGRMPGHIKKQVPCLVDERNRNAYTVLHSFSHLIIREACKESGYSLGSIRERLYFDAEAGRVKHASILLYTSGSSSDGTLGGLAGQCTLKRMRKIIHSALQARCTCSNDPVCFEHQPLDREPNGAACHTCLILPETSCECRNHMLDRNWGASK